MTTAGALSALPEDEMFRSLSILPSVMLIAPGVAQGDILWGVNGHPITAYPGISISRQLDLAVELGMKSYRVNVPDANSKPILDELVAEGRARGIDILPVITPAETDLDNETEDELYGKAHKLAVTLGTWFKEDIRVWELGNEMENYAILQPCDLRDDGTQYPCDWGPAGGVTAGEYHGERWRKVSAVLKGLADGIKEVDPDLRTAIGTAGWGHLGAFERMHRDGIEWDISVWHMYGDDPEWAFKKLAQYGKPIWVTEFNHPRGSQHGDIKQAEGLVFEMRRLMGYHQAYNVEAAHIYELLDEPYWAPDFEAYMGLVRLTETPEGSWTTGEPKPAYVAAREVIRGRLPLRQPARGCDLDSQKRWVSYGYCLVLGRSPDVSEFEHWSSKISNEQNSVDSMLVSMIDSNEFFDNHKFFTLTNRQYISSLFQLLLGRDVDQYGLDTYSSELRKGNVTRGGVALGILRSAEFKSRHETLFNLMSDAPG